MKVLCTGGLGYIGSHTVVEILNRGHEVVVIDDLSNSKIDVVEKIKTITGKDIKFYRNDVCDEAAVEKLFSENPDIFAVIHFAGFKAVGESCREPLKYYRNNIGSTITLLNAMKRHNCKNIVFSSSACVYAPSEVNPIEETFALCPSNPYGQTKLINEQLLQDFQAANPEFNVTLLRYFNPIGAHESGLLGEDPNGIPNNLMPYICKVATGELDYLNVFGDDYDTKDGTGVRDYIHVVDLANGHMKALEQMINNEKLGVKIYNLGTGTGYSVLDIVNTFNKVNGNLVKYQITDRRPGDLAEYYGSPKKAEAELGFKTTKTLEDMCKSSYEYARKNKVIEKELN